jgi:preprotein translocase subunit SecA
VRAAGGLHVLGTERHEARRIDDQLRGRAGRQGDPGSSQFYLSLEDDLLRIFGSERLQSLFSTLKIPEDMPLESKIVTSSLGSAQKRVEGHNFDMRKHLVEYDDVINRHRESVYRRRRAALEAAADPAKTDEMSAMVLEYIDAEVSQLVSFFAAKVTEAGNPDKAAFEQAVRQVIPLHDSEVAEVSAMFETADAEQLTAKLTELAHAKYKELAERIAAAPSSIGVANPLGDMEKRILLHAMDTAWIGHLQAMDQLRTGIGLRGYGQRDPLVEYKQEGYRLYQQLQDAIRGQVVRSIFSIGSSLAAAALASPMAKANVTLSGPAESGEAVVEGESAHRADVQQFGHKVGRNDPCPCGSGKKYKKCHGA